MNTARANIIKGLILGLLALPIAACNGGGSGSGSSSTTGSGGGVTSSPTPSATPTMSHTNTASVVSQPNASDPYMGTHAVTYSEYQLPAAVDNDVLKGVSTQEWAAVYLPQDLGTQRYPLVIFLHGNHSTCGSGNEPIIEEDCTYTNNGSCPVGEAQIPSYLGYEYLATHLASWGYAVISINANLGITCGTGVTGDEGLVLARGALVLRHLDYLAKWNTSGGNPTTVGVNFQYLFDLTNVGLMGHSRGGEGVRAAYNLYQSTTPPASGTLWSTQISSPITFRGIFEIGPTDGMSADTLNASGAAWNVILPMCDGDVSDLEGMKPFDRMLADTTEFPSLPKSQWNVFGANHDFYNTEWQTTDSDGCVGSTPLWTSTDWESTNQQETAIAALVPFFRAHVGVSATESQAAVLDPVNTIPAAITSITRIDRSYVATPNQSSVTRAETFQGAADVGSLGQPMALENVTLKQTTVSEHDSSLMAGEVTWSSAGTSVYFQDNWMASGTGYDLSNYSTLDFRTSRALNTTLNAAASTDFEVQLVFYNGTLGPAVSLSSYYLMIGPLGTETSGSPIYHETLPTVRIPMTALNPNNVPQAMGVRFTFSSTASGDIYISDIDLSRTLNLEATAILATPIAQPEDVVLESQLRALASESSAGGAIRNSRLPSARLSRFEKESQDSIVVEITSDTKFRVRDALPVLMLNSQEAAVGSFPTSGDLHTMIFHVKKALIDQLPENFSMQIQHRGDNMPTRDLGNISKSIL